MLLKVANYMNQKHASNYLVYNLYKDRQLDGARRFFHQVTEYPFPKAYMAEGLQAENPKVLKFATAPPSLR